MSSPALLNCSRRAAPLGTEDGSSLHHPAAGGAEHHGIGRWIISWMVGGPEVCVRTFRDWWRVGRRAARLLAQGS